ncbi:shikimate kinase [Sandarakinorhabdus sp. AAP62]|uniref:shikimate kinase n=1 Tax=Sandarakinorhabdus sp. AAP62 TaxID=1248916 RepID=UPI00030759E3|nr:shikimate kinase [Sandarakinorhabdus sp. AAP62]
MDGDPKIPHPKTSGEADRLALAAQRPVTLVGLMGSGKSSIGKRLAARLNLPFVDADTEIEEAAGMTISEMFERFGEAHFRDGERRVIARLIDGTPKVIATGGGAFMNDETRALILERTLSVWLDADIATLVDRVRRRGTRPLLKGKDPGEVLTALAAIRNPIYAQARIRVGSKPGPHHETVEAIVSALAAANAEEAAR